MTAPFHVLILHGDGSRVMRVRLPRWLAYGTVGFVASVVSVAVGISSDYVVVKRQSGKLATLRRHVASQRALLGAFETGVATVSSEINAWRELHRGMWDALGPEVGSSREIAGVGGAPSASPMSAPESTGGPLEELDRLTTDVTADAPRVRELADLIGRTGKIMSALPLRWPVRGAVTSPFGVRPSPWSGAPEQHEGLDIGSAPGTPIESPAAGRVVAANTAGTYGRHVTLDHGNGVRSRYGHLQQVDVKVGQRVERGEVIGRVGTGPRSPRAKLSGCGPASSARRSCSCRPAVRHPTR
jgi:hypothetical protein